MLHKFALVFLLFLIYSLIGYIVEVISVSSIEKKVTFSRGFLIGPYLPIYGTGALIMSYFLTKYKNDVIVLFVMSTVLCSILEYLTSLIMEKIFKLRWWDYSNKSFNINGRICLSNAVLFGIGGVLVVKFVNPILLELLNKLPNYLVLILAIVLMLDFLADLILSTYIMFRLKINVKKYTNKDATFAIRNEVRKALKKHTFLTTRLFNAFPNISQLNNKNFNAFKELIYQTKKEVKKLK